jgi:pimeloyl-ACP methyl ester carboxylesterase
MLLSSNTFSVRMLRTLCSTQVRQLNTFGNEAVLTVQGGPGEGGVDNVLGSMEKNYTGGRGEKWSKMWGVNLVSFDPRSTGWSGPKVSCAPANTTAQPLLGRRATQEEYRQAFDGMASKNLACNEANKDTDAKYVGTSAVVQDMMHFVELEAAAKGKKPEEATINYYGISYGTVIGQTLAQMYPDRLRRVLLDANVNGVTHYQGWAPDSLNDMAHSFWMFANLCFEAGPEWCALAKGMSSTKDIQYRLDRVMTQLDNEPIVICTQPLNRFVYLQAARSEGLYHPRTDEHYNQLVNLTIAAESRDETAMTAALVKMLPQLAPLCSPSKRDAPPGSGAEIQIITAVDVAGRYPWKNFEDWMAATKRIPPTYGDLNFASANG